MWCPEQRKYRLQGLEGLGDSHSWDERKDPSEPAILRERWIDWNGIAQCRRQEAHRVHDKDHADGPIGDPARIVEDEHADDDITKRDTHEARNNQHAILAPRQEEREASEIADERQVQKDQDWIARK